MKKNLTILTSVFLVCFGQAQYKIIDLGILPGGDNYSFGYGINQSGSVCGIAQKDFRMAFVWSSSTGMQPLTNTTVNAYDINDFGQIVGSNQSGFDRNSYIWDPEEGLIEIPDLAGGTTFSTAFGVNNSGQVAGTGTGSLGSQAFVWDRTNGVQELGSINNEGHPSEAFAINESGQVVGTARTGLNLTQHAFIWDSVNGMQDIDGTPTDGRGSFAYGINDHGVAVGLLRVTSTGDSGFIWDSANGMRQLVGLSGGFQAGNARDINNNGLIVGTGTTATGSKRATIWDSNLNIFDLNSLASENNTGLTLREAWGVNDSGMITGYASMGTTTHAFLAVPVPEPGTMFALLGLPVILSCRKRIKKPI